MLPFCKQDKNNINFQNVLVNLLTLADVETEYITEELFLISVRNNGINIKYISIKHQTFKVYN